MGGGVIPLAIGSPLVVAPPPPLARMAIMPPKKCKHGRAIWVITGACRCPIPNLYFMWGNLQMIRPKASAAI